ncbi:hypothetical protein SAMN05443144_101109 [Fodinibius roseus]|uniref:Asparagine synthase (Glutamine-hydrolysing) n=1 Tax=Fodinibius roseus TaxID=1194090 RepID=A0A1M4SS46_9BACT|nr:hypothetical protein [Fodinibius roseus]SHE35060.1 hypothetical protein SAMN05443144_101109 [Fodinibius roseus]
MGMDTDQELLTKLKFRRQFLIGPTEYSPNKYWKTEKLYHGLVLSIHTDLNFFSGVRNGCKITLIGIAVDCTSPYKNAPEIISSILESCGDILSVITASKPLAGRWVILFQDKENSFLFTDPCGLRQVYYYTDNEHLWYASQPTLINQVTKLPLTSDESILRFKNSMQFKQKESAWIGDKTAYENCFHLMPNHYLDLNDCCQVRFFPNEPIATSQNENELIPETAQYLQNIILGLDHKFNIRICLTAGFDSRLLLAASVDISDSVIYSTDTLGIMDGYCDDIYIPKRLARKFNLHHEVINSATNPPSWFSRLLAKNVHLARTSPLLRKTKSIYSAISDNGVDYILINGNVTELVRIHERAVNYEPFIDDETRRINLNPLLNFYDYNSAYINREIEKWVKTFDISAIDGITVFDMFYWEQRMSKWGALFPAELDIAKESISPFNCRLLLETCFKVPREQRIAPEIPFFRGVIKQLWPEILSEPINPGPRGWGLLKQNIRRRLPAGMVKVIQKMIK